MAFEEPEVGIDVELGHDFALAVLAAVIGDRGDAVEHQHRRQRQLGIAGAEQLPPGAGEQALEGGSYASCSLTLLTVLRPLRLQDARRQNRDAEPALRKPARTAPVCPSAGPTSVLTYGQRNDVSRTTRASIIADRLRGAPACGPPASGWNWRALLFEGGDRHVTAESLHDEVQGGRMGVAGHGLQHPAPVHRSRPAAPGRGRAPAGPISTPIPATTSISSSRRRLLIDIPADDIAVAGVPAPPAGITVDRVDVVVRVRR